MSRVSWLKSAYVSRVPPVPHSWAIQRSVSVVMNWLYSWMAERRKAGLDNRRCRRHSSPSLTRRPLPAKALPGKKAVPAFTNVSASSMTTCRTNVGSLRSTTYSPARTIPTLPPYLADVFSKNLSGSCSKSIEMSPVGPGGKPGGRGRTPRVSLSVASMPIRKKPATSNRGWSSTEARIRTLPLCAVRVAKGVVDVRVAIDGDTAHH
mmetsp:Transcript_77099/g.135975  ORF Transcript_77099/g.135975 Transcript_77099/m.135975 type:complete len:207 (-) Transcript_77099:193-813(-)